MSERARERDAPDGPKIDVEIRHLERRNRIVLELVRLSTELILEVLPSLVINLADVDFEGRLQIRRRGGVSGE